MLIIFQEKGFTKTGSYLFKAIKWRTKVWNPMPALKVIR